MQDHMFISIFKKANKGSISEGSDKASDTDMSKGNTCPQKGGKVAALMEVNRDLNSYTDRISQAQICDWTTALAPLAQKFENLSNQIKDIS